MPDSKNPRAIIPVVTSPFLKFLYLLILKHQNIYMVLFFSRTDFMNNRIL